MGVWLGRWLGDRGLYFKEEVACAPGGPSVGTANCLYCEESTEYPCAPGKTYHGRGPIQLSWNYNYGLVGAHLGLDLLNNPDRILEDAITAFRTAFDFWMTPQFPKLALKWAMRRIEEGEEERFLGVLISLHVEVSSQGLLLQHRIAAMLQMFYGGPA
ncbi:hypothetical protein CBR_g3887 [Chara braunii]|uniref:Glycoside hydrolase family 19 catalytic domain-containing protein n=1 Tax=Chara braunii TaxID=69332 RepID=A0A388KGP6_CHABU|nr:hypothetical protein CBR_g3887 [Chara braunii]|eukprot:GBG69188.1 hypothetical protein CBR_g3887 [Chara braunii]